MLGQGATGGNRVCGDQKPTLWDDFWLEKAMQFPRLALGEALAPVAVPMAHVLQGSAQEPLHTCTHMHTHGRALTRPASAAPNRAQGGGGHLHRAPPGWRSPALGAARGQGPVEEGGKPPWKQSRGHCTVWAGNRLSGQAGRQQPRAGGHGAQALGGEQQAGFSRPCPAAVLRGAADPGVTLRTEGSQSRGARGSAEAAGRPVTKPGLLMARASSPLRGHCAGMSRSPVCLCRAAGEVAQDHHVPGAHG